MLTLEPFTEDHGRSMVHPHEEGSHLSVSLRLNGFATHRLAHMLDSLVRVSRRVGWKARNRQRPERAGARRPATSGARLQSPTGAAASAGSSQPRFCPAKPAHADQRPALSGGPALAVPHPTGAHPQPPFASLPAISSTF